MIRAQALFRAFSSSIASRRLFAAALVPAALLVPRLAEGATYHYVDWTAADVPGGTASGTITLPGGSVVTVTFAALNQDLSPGNLYNAQTSGGTDYWKPALPYTSVEVENPPPDTDILQLSGGQNQTYKVTLSEPIKDPVMAIVSLGQAGVATTYDFDAPFTIVSQAAGYWGGSDTALTMLAGDVLQGLEGHGTIRFIGTFSTFSWTVPTPETWHGFTFAIRTTEAIEPSDAGAGEGGVEPISDAGTADSGGSKSDAGAADSGSSPGAGLPPKGGSSTSSCNCSLITPGRTTMPLLLGGVGLGMLALRSERRRRKNEDADSKKRAQRF